MTNKLTSHAGWLVAGAMGVFMMTSGFQAGTAKFGVVDVTKVIMDSTAGKALKEDLTSQFNIRQGLMEFVSTNPVITGEQATKLRELSLKAGATAADKTEVENIKKAVQSDQKKFESLGLKGELTEKERSELEDLGARRRNAQGILQRWEQEFTRDLGQVEADKQGALLDSVKAVIQSEGKKQGYTVVFQSNVAIYSANDLTDEIVKALNAKG